MKCPLVQQRLLAARTPERMPAALRSHLARCAACREWHNQLLLLEQHIPLLPIPASHGKARCLRQLLQEPAPAPRPVARPAPPAMAAAAPRFRSRRVLLSAAAVLLLALGWWTLQTWTRPAALPPARLRSDTLLANLVQRDLRLAQADTPRERLEILADVADDLHGETHALVQAASAGELTALAKLYEEVVGQGILKQAQAIPIAERPRTLEPLSQRMAEAAQRVEALAQELPAAHAEPLRLIAAIARAAQRQLRNLVSERKG